MSTSIHRLPENTANQIAAGEVVQRPASVVKELLENSVDAGASLIKLYFKNGGITFIQVDDNGKGMSLTDALMCWERHATSKIQKAEDLYDLSTLGFRGEALASIASVSDIYMKTSRSEDEVGTSINLKAGKNLEQDIVAHPQGTSITVKNLFYNIPARKNFLKSITVETKHIFEEFQRIALAYPDIGFELYNQDKVVHKLKPSHLKMRLSELLKVDEKQLLVAEEDTDIVRVSGFIGTPKVAKRTRGNQFLFANGRFIKDPYLNHAISSAYGKLLEDKQYPFYALFLEVDPAKIDVNIHPTKHEVKFEDGKHVYSLLHSTIKKSLGSFFVLPGEDNLFDMDMGDRDPRAFNTSSPDKRFNPFEPSKKKIRTEWEKLDELLLSEPRQSIEQSDFFERISQETVEVGTVFQIAEQYIVLNHQGELWVINQHRAHEQVLYERFKSRKDHSSGTQQLLFPRTLDVTAADLQLFHDLQEEINRLGFDVSEFGKSALIINGLPAELSKEDGADVLQHILDEFKLNHQQMKSDKKEALIQATAKNAAIKAGKRLNESEMKQLVSDLLNCNQKNLNPKGLTIAVKFDKGGLDRLFI